MGHSSSSLNNNQSNGSHLSSNLDTTKQSKQSKKILSEKKKEKDDNISIDLDLINPYLNNIESPIISWNCHHKLENIKKTLIQIQSNYTKNNKNKQKHKTSLSSLSPKRFCYIFFV